LAGELPAVHDRHLDVRHDQVELVALRELVQSVLSIDGGLDLVPFRQQVALDDVTEKWSVVDQEQSPGPGRGDRRTRRDWYRFTKQFLRQPVHIQEER